MIAALLFLLLGCADSSIHPVPGTTFRVSDAIIKQTKGIEVYPFVDQLDCAGAKILEKTDPSHACNPFVDRASGQVRLSFQPRVGNGPWPMALSKESVNVTFNHRSLTDGFTFIPHDPQPTNQIFILLIDTSGSMQQVDDTSGLSRLEKVRRATTQKDVVSAFFPPDGNSEVVPLMFHGSPVPIPLSTKPYVDNPTDYVNAINQGLSAGVGFTPLYKAIDYVLTTTLESKEISGEIQLGHQPTLIALTDGFNNEDAADDCAANVSRLNTLLATIRKVRQDQDSVAHRPSIFTVGLGRPRWSAAKLPAGDEVTPDELCGSYGKYIINNGLELKGVDNRALAFIAHVADGASYIRPDQAGLAQAFEAAAQSRYKWFEVRFSIDRYYLRRAFEVQLGIQTTDTPNATVKFIPNPWLDGPPGEVVDNALGPAPTIRSVGIVLPLLGAALSLSYLPAAWFNGRRALFGLVPRRRKK